MSQIAPISPPAPDAAPTDATSAPAAAGATQQTNTQTQSPSSATPANDPGHAPNQRLLIQESGELGVFVYTVLDRSSGKVLIQIPQIEVADMATSETYSSGAVIDTKA